MDNSSQTQLKKMTSEPIPKLVISLAIPTIISMLITSIYNMADTFFVSKLGTSAAGAVGIVFPIMSIIQGVAFTLGMGSGSIISRYLGAKKNEEANTVSSTGFYSSLVVGVIIFVFGIIFLDDLMIMLGASDTILPYARSYAGHVLAGTPFIMGSFVLNNLLRSEGKAKFAVRGIGSGGILNMILDPIFIFTFKLGVAGAAIATVISQIVSFIILLSHFIAKKSSTTLNPKNISSTPIIYWDIIKTGLPSFARQGLASISNVLLNRSAVVYGDPAVAAMSITGRIVWFIFSVLIGFGQGYQPVVGYNYGAKLYGRVKEAFIYYIKVGTIFMSVLALAGFIFAPNAIKMFIEYDPQVITIGTTALRANCIMLPFVTLGVVCNMTFQSSGKSWSATLLSSMRQGLFFIPAILILPHVCGLFGIQIAQSVADLLTFTAALPFAILFYKTISMQEKSYK